MATPGRLELPTL